MISVLIPILKAQLAQAQNPMPTVLKTKQNNLLDLQALFFFPNYPYRFHLKFQFTPSPPAGMHGKRL